MRFSTTVVLSLMNTISALATPVEVVERSTDTGQNVGWKTGPAGQRTSILYAQAPWY